MKNTWTPTCKLRFVKRRVKVPAGGFGMAVQYQDVRVLQQWWAQSIVQMGWGDVEAGPGEWRDVELVEDADEA